MGACYSADVNTAHIEANLAQEERKQNKTKKILFLGPGGSGKSTIFKQLQWLHLDGFTSRDATKLKKHIFNQLITQMLNVIKYYEKHDDNTTYHDDALKEAINTVKMYDLRLETQFNPSLADAIQYIWRNDHNIKNVFNDYNVTKYQILDETTEHFWNDIDRIKHPKYIPNEDDILCVRCRTTGIAEKEFMLKGTRFHIFDVGGQKSERRKWIYLFSNVKLVLFVISLSCYDQFTYQDSTKNCMVDSLELFDEIVNHKNFEETNIILFLNKKDLFDKKILSVPITECPAFHDYDKYKYESEIFVSNPNDIPFDRTTAYIRDKFRALNKIQEKEIYTHLTYAMDRKNIDRVFLDVHRIIVNENLSAFI